MKKPRLLCTRQSLYNDLCNLGIKQGDTILLHSSLSSLGWVCGGAETIVHALNPPVPEEWHEVIRNSMPAYDPRTTGARTMGIIAETVRTWPGAVRSAHPHTSFSAIGAKAGELVADHALDCRLGEKSPLARLGADNARVLLLGVGFECCTAFHLAKYRLPNTSQENVSFAACFANRRQWVTVQDTAVSEDGFDRLRSDYERDGSVISGTVGGASARLFPLASAVNYAQSWLPKHRPGICDK
ncbi:hypothetical protein BDW74DRAFT_167778 [Aspergillus multicolor]|uniref:aminoglycoside N(3)-acetyltransferase n=1 Tax=Aspergillus multicolor TaxID=41759 RepID=UPI003CCDD022